ncbi:MULTISPECIES: hypothetical protein [unclassified Sporosarcina]|uniref:hypothetical protein n=1 Tax=unclassified Sporosarcina TaxID=2647733 RepID=UPI000C17125E|nr:MULTISPECIES: hypothetical protein [unclassified Sporosarcina]PID04579.1 hypothetical protein CSV66_14390 [Sporosarcina sp. P30]PID07722.1 hypothetical protein CSV65_14655 [Sporosarcina sp. P31]PID10920.1 hypothetical protein CSV64_14625 [Sporosarcina sp. P32b]
MKMNIYFKHPLKYRVHINLVRDFGYFLSQQLQHLDVKVAPEDPNVHLKFFEINRRIIEKRPRMVFSAKGFSYPSEISSRVELLIKKIHDGDSILPHLSRSYLKPNYHDALLNEWGIHHLHLGTEVDSDGFVNRDRSNPLNDYLLFLRITTSDAYLIKIGRHNEWTNKELFEVLHENWNDTISQYQIESGLTLTENEPNEVERYKLRKSGIFTLTSAKDGSIYFPIGGGYASSKNSLKAVRESQYYLNYLTHIELSIKNNITQLIRSMKSININIENELIFHLFIFNSKFYLWDTKSNLFICLSTSRAYHVPLTTYPKSMLELLLIQNLN